MFAKAGIETQTDGGKGKPARNVVGFHSLRHTFVSIAANAGIPFALVLLFAVFWGIAVASGNWR